MSTTTAPRATEDQQGGSIALGWVRGQMQQFLAFVSLIVIVIFFSFASPNFLTASNLTGILVASVTIGLLALGTTAVIITGGIDLSIGTAMILSGVMTGVFLVHWNLPLWVGVIGGVLFGAVIGLVNGLVVSYLGIPPFIATLAMMLVTIGASLGDLGDRADPVHQCPRIQRYRQHVAGLRRPHPDQRCTAGADGPDRGIRPDQDPDGPLRVCDRQQ
ncbi:ABC transporter permease [Tsukamurella paurometabola]|uniref:ABC transporter permease n=1 Tax=Tsukamurella paurometabola TaxID=2061 RepID=UPI00019F05B1|nr:ABC transporter permease [Tsukamurella paurometabola]